MTLFNSNSTNHLGAVPNPAKPKAMVIDDAFDTDIFVPFSTYLEFYNQLVSEEKIDWFKEKIYANPPDILGNQDDSSDEYKKFINNLWNLRNDKTDLRSELDFLFNDILSKQADLDEICKNISKQEFDVQKLDSKQDGIDFVKGGDFKIIFLDHNLGAHPGPEAIKNARQKAEKLYQACPDDSKPMIILMSSFDDVENKLTEFRREFTCGNVVFRATPKNMLINDGTAALLVQAYKNESEHIHKLQIYITKLKEAATNALREFNTDVDSITIDDYSFIHNTTVMDQAHPLGDYLGWLYGARWSSLLLKNRDLKDQKDILDKLLMDKPTLHHAIPSSDRIVEIFMSALFEEASGDITDHPMAGALVGESPKKILAKLPHLHLGDILINEEDSGTLWMVLNPQCDLERLAEDSVRNSLLLMPGELIPFDTRSVTGPKTELIIVNGKQYRIVWKLKQVISIQIGNFSDWANEKKLRRKFTLRLPYALEVQHAFASIISRVGLPTSPPFTYKILIEVWIKDGNKMKLLLERSKEYGFRAITRTANNTVRLTLHFALKLKEKIFERYKELVEETSRQESSKNKQLSALQIKLKDLLDKFDDWYIKTPMIQLPGSKKQEVLKGLVEIRENFDNVENTSNPPILVNLITATQPEVDEDAEQKAESLLPTAKVDIPVTNTGAMVMGEELISYENVDQNPTSNSINDGLETTSEKKEATNTSEGGTEQKPESL